MARRAGQQHPEQDVADRSQIYSPAERLQRKEFSEMTPEELDTIHQLVQTMEWDITRRTTRRRVADKHGRTLHLRRILRSAAQYGGVPLRLAYQSRKVKQRPLILIADVSGSMEKYARLLLQFFYSVSHRFHHVETFLFGTRLTRITGQLKLKNMDRAIEDAAREVVDWAGGTRIGDSLLGNYLSSSLLLACLLLIGCLPSQVPVTTRVPLPTATESPTVTVMVPTATTPPTTTIEPTPAVTVTTEPMVTATALPTALAWLSALSGNYLLYEGGIEKRLKSMCYNQEEPAN